MDAMVRPEDHISGGDRCEMLLLGLVLNSEGKHSDRPWRDLVQTLGREVADIEVLNLWGYCNYCCSEDFSIDGCYTRCLQEFRYEDVTNDTA